MKPHHQNTKPEGLEPFDIDKHLKIVSTFANAVEEATYALNGKVGSKITKADGLRVAFDVIHIRSLINPGKDSIYLTYGSTIGNQELPGLTSCEIAGIIGDELWLTNDGVYFSASDELKWRREFAEARMAPLKHMFKDLQQQMEQLFGEDLEGEEWKRQQRDEEDEP